MRFDSAPVATPKRIRGMKVSKADELIKVADELKYLSDEYGSSPIFGSADGDVKFSTLFDYLSDEDNQRMVEHLIKTIKEVEAVTSK
jgi:hypothetical protein